MPRQDDAQENGWESRAIPAALEGNEAAFGELVRHYSTRIYTHLFRLVDSREEAEDLAQETFLRAFRFLPSFDQTRTFRNWLYAIATNVGLNHLRRRKRRGKKIALETAFGERTKRIEPVSGVPDGRARAARGELKDRLDKAIQQLPERPALLVHLHYQEGMSIREAAELVGMKEGAARVALHRARGQLREWLVEENKES